MITYKSTGLGADVYLDNKIVGIINMTTLGYFTYRPKGSKKCGKFYETLEECKKSLEGDK